jgi:SAM-dependent methyltransferase
MMAPEADLDQRARWNSTFAARADFLGAEPSEPGRAALARFRADGVQHLLELGPGQGRDTLLFAAAGLSVTALDFAAPGLEQIATKAAKAGVADRVRTIVGDVRDRLPVADASVDAVYAHMLLCMSLTTAEVDDLTREVGRVLRAGGLFAYTVRNTSDAHYGAGIDHGDDRWEMGGFVVHFFDRALVDRLAVGFELMDVADHVEGRLPRRLYGVTMRKPGQLAQS